MPQNGPYSGPPWSSSGKGAEEPYGEPSDPWGDYQSAQPSSAQPGPDQPWGGHSPPIPQQPAAYEPGPSWSPPPPPPAKRNTPMMALVVTLSVLMLVGLGATLWLLKERGDNNRDIPAASASTSPVADPGPAPVGSEDARYNVKKGDCVVNEGSEGKPEMRTTACTSGAFDVLDRIEGKTSGEADAERKCGKVRGYTKWYYYDSELDDLDFVLCLKEH